jgi:hypothetical protein
MLEKGFCEHHVGSAGVEKMLSAYLEPPPGDRDACDVLGKEVPELML